MFNVQNPLAGHNTIIGTTYPGRCKVKLRRLRGETLESESSGSGSFSITLNEPLKSGDFIVISFSKQGWKDNSTQFQIY